MADPLKFAGVWFALSATLAGCSQHVHEIEERTTVRLSITTGTAQTRTAIGADGSFYWTDGDALKLMQTAGGTFAVYDSDGGTISEDGRTATFGVTLDAVSAAQYSYAAFYPKSSLAAEPTSASEVQVSLPPRQAPVQTSYDPAADVLLAMPITVTSQPTELSMRFRRPCAIGRIAIKALPTTDPISYISLSAVSGGTDVTLAGATTFDLSVAGANPDEWGDATTLTLDCSGVDFDAVGAVLQDYQVLEFDWDYGTASDSGDPVSTLSAGQGVYFTCWPFALGEGDSFTVSVTAGTRRYTRAVTMPSGRSLEFHSGDLSIFSVNMSSAAVEDVHSGRYAAYVSGAAVEAGSVSLSPASGLEAVYVENDLTLSDATCQGRIYFVGDGATLTVGSGARLRDTYIVGNTPGARPVVNIPSGATLSGASPASGAVVLEDVTIEASSLNETMFKFATATGTGLDRLVIDGCKLNYGGKGLFWVGNASGASYIRDFELTGCRWAICAPALTEPNSSWVLQTSAESDGFEHIVIRDNVLHSSEAGVSRRWRAVSGPNLTVGSVVLSGNVLLDLVSPSEIVMAGTVGDYTARGNLCYSDDASIETLYFAGPVDMYSEPAGSSSHRFLVRMANFTDAPTGTIDVGDNMICSAVSGNYLYDYVYGNNAAGTLRYSVPAHQIAAPFSSVDVAAGTFTYNRILGQSTAMMDGRKVWNPMVISSKTVYIRHDPVGDQISELEFDCLGGGTVTGGLSGSWPAKTLTVSRDGASEDWTVRLLDAPSSSDIQALSGAYSGYAWDLKWADEFLLDDYDRETWLRRTWSGSGTYNCYYVSPALYSGFDDLVQVEGGDLVIRAKYTGDSSLGANGYVSGGVNTYVSTDRGVARKSFKMCDASDSGFWGRIDVRASYKLGSTDQGIRAAIWMLADDYFNTIEDNTPGGKGEIDILEHPSHIKSGGVWKRNYETCHTVHTHYTYTDIGKTGGVQYKVTNSDESVYHVYTVMIAYDNFVRFFVDGNFVGEYRRDTYSSDGAAGGYPEWHWWPFDHFNYYMLFTHQLLEDQSTANEKGWDGPASGPFTDTRMNIDYIRYFTKK